MSEFSRKTNVLMQHKYHYSLQDMIESSIVVKHAKCN